MKKLIFAVAIAALAGCVYRGAKVTEGVDVSVGMNVPSSDGALQVSFFNYLSGFRFGLAQNSQMKMTYYCCQTNSFLGLSHTVVEKKIEAEVLPCEDDQAAVSKSKKK